MKGADSRGFAELHRLAELCAANEEFADKFATEEACRRWFIDARARNFRCTRCFSSRGVWLEVTGVFRCGRCLRRQSLTAGTALHGTRKPLRTWFEALFLIVQRGVNARVLQRELGLTYKIAWVWGHKLRHVVAGFVVPPEPRPHEQRHFMASRVSRETYVWPPDGEAPCGCARLRAADFEFEHGGDGDPAGGPPERDREASQELLLTYSGSVSEKHLVRYLDETAFRLNWSETELRDTFEGAAEGLTLWRGLTYRQIVGAPVPRAPLSIFACELLPAREVTVADILREFGASESEPPAPRS
jgi:hypothetical protein